MSFNVLEKFASLKADASYKNNTNQRVHKLDSNIFQIRDIGNIMHISSDHYSRSITIINEETLTNVVTVIICKTQDIDRAKN